MAKERGYLVNYETKRGQLANYAIGEPLPADSPVLQDRRSVAELWEGNITPPPTAEESSVHETDGDVEPVHLREASKPSDCLAGTLSVTTPAPS